jgi:AAA15 family ATPase/GTPase
MIVSISVSNFRSFHHEETFALTASNRFAGHHDDHLVPIPGSDQSVLRLGVIYGANGAGKSNLFQALSYINVMALATHSKGSGTRREPFRLAKNPDEPSTFDLLFIAEGNTYRFGFKVDDVRVREEWLTRVVKGNEECLYERLTSDEGKVRVELEGLKGQSNKLTALASIGGPQNQTFLATVAATLDRGDCGDTLTAVLHWIEVCLQQVSPITPFGDIGRYLSDNPDCAEFAGEFLKSAATGIDHLQISKQQLSEEELRSLLPPFLIERVFSDLRDGTKGKSVIAGPDGFEVLIERSEETLLYKINIRPMHLGETGTPIAFELRDESDGTRRLLNLLPALHRLKSSNCVYFIDEIDRSLHPKLVLEFVEFFLATQKHHNSQLILTTHDTNLLDLELLRRDEIWFAEKDRQSATHLYSLTDFKVRKDLQISKHYLDGRFGAVPFMGDIKRLIAKEAPAE